MQKNTLNLLTRRELAQLVRLSVRTIDEHVARGNLRPVRIGRAVRFTPGEVRRWLAGYQSQEVDRG